MYQLKTKRSKSGPDIERKYPPTHPGREPYRLKKLLNRLPNRWNSLVEAIEPSPPSPLPGMHGEPESALEPHTR